MLEFCKKELDEDKMIIVSMALEASEGQEETIPQVK